MELDERSKKAIRELGDSINAAVEESERVAQALAGLRELGYAPNLSLKLDIGLLEISPETAVEERELEMELTDEDLKTLRKMKISLE